MPPAGCRPATEAGPKPDCWPSRLPWVYWIQSSPSFRYTPNPPLATQSTPGGIHYHVVRDTPGQRCNGFHALIVQMIAIDLDIAQPDANPDPAGQKQISLFWERAAVHGASADPTSPSAETRYCKAPPFVYRFQVFDRPEPHACRPSLQRPPGGRWFRQTPDAGSASIVSRRKPRSPPPRRGSPPPRSGHGWNASSTRGRLIMPSRNFILKPASGIQVMADRPVVPRQKPLDGPIRGFALKMQVADRSAIGCCPYPRCKSGRTG